ncbi:MAG: EscU/YscU/HrcU family type III secretion system export apparatus switch protein [Acidobacteriota bacterium]
MADSGQRTEKPTQRRLDRARREGNFPASREFVTSVHFIGAVWLIVTFTGPFILRTAHLMRYLLVLAFADKNLASGVASHPGGKLPDDGLTLHSLVAISRDIIGPYFVPLILGGLGLLVAVVLAQMITTGFGLSPSKLAPDLKRLSLGNKLKNLPAQNIPVFLQALALLPLVGFVVYYEIKENLHSFMALVWMTPRPAMARIGAVTGALLWRAAGLFFLIGIIDLIWQRRRFNNQLKMSKQEIRDESKDQEGNPQIKARVRRIQRDMARKNMMKEVPKATAIIVNPTHYAVAILYELPTEPGVVGAAPKVVAKGKNYLAARIRKLALQHQVPIVENPPLARALYSSVDVGKEIPAHLYRAVAEILAYIYRLMNGRLPGGGR